ncbi:MAG: hypothetical protein LBS36_00175 [Oscillospiraceae bacterium]|jgi:hypothetical protein|nr:hypothetical protein [Oscillospiraceae bacterium]
MSQSEYDALWNEVRKNFESTFGKDKKLVDEFCSQQIEIEKLKLQMKDTIYFYAQRLEECEERMKEIESRPRAMWDKVTGSAVAAIVSVLVAAFMSLILK